MTRFHNALAPAGLALAVALASAGMSLAQETVLPPDARPMTPEEMHQLYKNRSWQWESGAGLMRDEGRAFSAWVEDANGPSWAEGKWVLTTSGHMCMRATWYSASGAFPAETCFAHQIAGATIYQKSEPSGQWYVFRHDPPQADDEAAKLVRSDLVSAQLPAIQAKLHGQRPVTDQRPVAGRRWP